MARADVSSWTGFPHVEQDSVILSAITSRTLNMRPGQHSCHPEPVTSRGDEPE